MEARSCECERYFGYQQAAEHHDPGQNEPLLQFQHLGLNLL